MNGAPTLFRDFETRSAADLVRTGPWRYAADPTTQVVCVAYAVDAEPVQVWLPGQPIPEVFFTAARDSRWLSIAHNAQFEHTIEQLVLGPRYGWPCVPLERQRCTMAMALAEALPGALESAAAALDLPHRKDQAGARLMRQMARPLSIDANTGQPIWTEDSERLERLCQYCARDVDATRALFKRLPSLSDGEQRLWALDSATNCGSAATSE
jgi:DNA polymerase